MRSKRAPFSKQEAYAFVAVTSRALGHALAASHTSNTLHDTRLKLAASAPAAPQVKAINT